MRSLSVRLRFGKKQFWQLPLPVNVPLQVRVWPWQLQDQPEHWRKKANCLSLIWDFFSILTQIQMDTLLTTVSLRLLWDWWILNDIEIALRNAHFRYRGSIEYRDTRDGIVIVVPISGIAQHYSQVQRCVVKSLRAFSAVQTQVVFTKNYREKNYKATTKDQLTQHLIESETQCVLSNAEDACLASVSKTKCSRWHTDLPPPGALHLASRKTPHRQQLL